MLSLPLVSNFSKQMSDVFISFAGYKGATLVFSLMTGL